MSKVCRTCSVDKPVTAFYTKVTKGVPYPQKDCKACVLKSKKVLEPKKAPMYKKFNLSEEQFLSMSKVCEICGIAETETGRALAIDHNHETGKVRGRLCIMCNTGIGGLQDSEALLLKAIEYLRRTNADSHTITSRLSPAALAAFIESNRQANLAEM